MGDITQLLQKWREGDRDAEDELVQAERPGHLRQPTEPLDQICLRLVETQDRDWHSRQDFFAITGGIAEAKPERCRLVEVKYL
jgi:hypothetical protein